MKVLRTTAIVDAPVRVVSAVLTERALFGGDGVLAPGDELVVGGGRGRVAELDGGGVRVVPVGRGVGVSVRLAATAAGVLVTVSVEARNPWQGLGSRGRAPGLLLATLGADGAG